MYRTAIAALSGLILASTANAMPSDLPWTDFTCKNGKTLSLKFLSDGESIDVKLGSDVKTVRPVDEKAEAGFKPGLYRGHHLRLRIGADRKTAALHGKGATGGPYKKCVASMP